MSRRKQLNPKALKRDGHSILQNESKPEMPNLLTEEEKGKDETLEFQNTHPTNGLEATVDSRSTSDTSEEKDHSELVEEIKSYRCSFCQRRCISLNQLKEHEQEHADLMPYRCRHCGKGFKHKRSQDRHEHLHTGYKKHKCEQCHAAFFRLDHLKLHMKTHDGRRSVDDADTSNLSSNDCSLCQLSFGSSEELLQHMDDEHNVLNGSMSGSGSTTPAEMSIGTSSTLLNRLYTCGMCSQTFNDTSQLQKHTLQKHTVNDLNGGQSSGSLEMSEDPRYGCDHCSQSFESILALHEHTNNTHSESQIVQSAGSYVCNQCNMCLSDLTSFSSHMREHINSNQEAARTNVNCQCEFCDKNFSSSAELLEHSMEHYLQKESSYSCGNCTGKSFTLPEELQKHLLELHAVQMFRCSLCKELFDSRVDIQVHFAVVHSQETVQWRCRSCNAAFHTREQFQFHVEVIHLHSSTIQSSPITPHRSSTSTPVYCCAQCNKMFSTESDYTEHCSTHLAPFQCPICAEAFTVEFLFERHMQNEHRGFGLISYGGFSCNTFGSDSIGDKFVPPPPPLTRAIAKQMTANSVTEGLIFPSSFDDPNLIKCNVCDERYETIHELAKHKLQHCKVLQSGICYVCHTEMITVDQFYCHTRQHNINTGPPVSCVVCRQSLLAPIEVQTHARFHLFLNCLENERFIELPLSEKCAQNNDTEVTENQSTECNDNELRCGECAVKCENVEELKKHESVVHPKPYQCIKCQELFATESQIRAHVASHVMQEGFEHHCLLCHQVFDSPSKLQIHLIEHSFAGCTEYQCYLCGLVFSMAQPLQKHMLTHRSDERPYDCHKCDQQFFFRAEMENHALNHHGKIWENNTKAETKSHPTNVVNSAPIVIVKKRSNIHSETNKDGDFPCPHCPKVFNSLSALQGHSHVHMTNRIHQCHKCDKSFATAAKLRNHQRKHAAAGKPFACEVCGRLFSRKDNLKVHMRSHASCAEETLPTMVIPNHVKTESQTNNNGTHLSNSCSHDSNDSITPLSVSNV